MAVTFREGDVLAGKYRVDRVLGEGGMGIVVAATHIDLEQVVALKFLREEATSNPDLVARFMREARAAVKLRSEHITRVLDVGRLESGAPYIVMEYLEGSDLGAVVRNGARPIAEAAECVLQACEALAEAHAQGIVHRDLKPANLFLTRRADGTPCIKVLDFGISKLNSQAITRTASVMGSPIYMSPEQMSSSKDVDARADIWALGIVLYELVTGRVPFDAETLPQVCVKVMHEQQTPMSTLRPGLPVGFEAVVSRCLEKDRARRPEDVLALARALAPFAPPRAQALVDRIAAISRPAATSQATQVSSIADERSATNPAAVVQTNVSWTRTGQGRRIRARAAAIVGSSLAAAVAIGVVIGHIKHGAPDASVAADVPTVAPTLTPSVATEPPPTAARAGADTPDVPTAAPSVTASADAVASAPPAPSAKVPTAAPRTGPRPGPRPAAGSHADDDVFSTRR